MKTLLNKNKASFNVSLRRADSILDASPLHSACYLCIVLASASRSVWFLLFSEEATYKRGILGHSLVSTTLSGRNASTKHVNHFSSLLVLIDSSSLQHTLLSVTTTPLSITVLRFKARPSACYIPQLAFLLSSQATIMASITATLSFLLMTYTALAGMVPMGQGPTFKNSLITLTYTPWMAPQIAPTSTVYQTIVTSYYNVISPPHHQ